MKALALGCGEMGKCAIRDLVRFGQFEKVVVGDIDLEKAEAFVKTLKSAKVKAHGLDVTEHKELVSLMREFDVVMSCVGPFYLFAIPVMKAAIEAKVNFVDICDDYDVTPKTLELDGEAKKARITMVTGLGASPGVTNVLARMAADKLDSVDEIKTAWIMSGADPEGGFAVAYHVFHSMYGKVPTYQDGRFVEVDAFVSGAEVLDFPDPIGNFEVFHVGHPEPVTLPRYIKGVKSVDDKGSFNPPTVKDMIVALGNMGFISQEPIQVKGVGITPLDFVVMYLNSMGKDPRMEALPKVGAVRVEARGRKGEDYCRVIYAGTAKMNEGTGIPASIGAQMLARGDVKEKGVFAPEGCIDPEKFMAEMNRRGFHAHERVVVETRRVV